MMHEFTHEVKKIAKEAADGVHTAFPGEIVDFDPGKCTATVQPKIQYKRSDGGGNMDYPQIYNVTVCFPKSSNQDFTIAFPIKPGDGCMIVVSEQSLEYWKTGQADNDLSHDMSNAMCIPGLYKESNDAVEEACADDAIVIKAKATKMKLKDNEVTVESTDIILKGNVTIEGSLSAPGLE